MKKGWVGDFLWLRSVLQLSASG